MPQPILIDSCDFSQIRGNGQIYVDKTAYLHRLINDPNGHLFFLARPRRFGKSLMLSTLKAIFQGRRKLFDGLAISRTDYDWDVHPVIHLNLGFCASENYEDFVEAMPVEMERALSEAGYAYDAALSPASNFSKAIDWFYAVQAAPVVLVDEYDDPVARALHDMPAANRIRGYVATLFGKLKDRVGKLRFVMITGVSKFTKMSIFSALSNIIDISFYDEYAAMLGFTEAELDEYYSEHIAAHARKMQLSPEAYRAELKRMYNGYRFWKYEGEKVYNPVSVNMNLVRQEPNFSCYWVETGRASMLMNFLKRESVLAVDPEKVSGVSASELEVTDLSDIPLPALLFQTGYLTITDFNSKAKFFTLGIPDEEVREDYAKLMAAQCARQSVHWAVSIGVKMLLGEWEAFFEGLKALYAGVAYGPQEKRVCEFSYGRCLAFLLQGQGGICRPEVVQANGRVDMVCTHPCGIYIFELKVDQPAAIAMEQIQRKVYAAPYAADKRPVWLLGLSFDSKTRQLVDCTVESFH